MRPQHPEELKKLLEWASTATSVLEVGSRRGETLTDLAHAMAGKRIVSIDWPNKENLGDASLGDELARSVKNLIEEGFDAYLIIGDSHHPDTLSRVTALGPYDFIFIDGDHSYKGVKKDYEFYGPLGKQIVFHDIIEPTKGRNKGLEVWKFWKEIKGEEFIGKDSLMGLGRVWNAS